MPNLGLASLAVALRGARSTVVAQYGQAPLQLHAPLYLAGANYPTVYLRTPSAGLLGGDEHCLSVDVEPGAVLELRTQAATLIYPGASRQVITLRLGAGSCLVFCAHPLIFAKDADFEQRVQIVLGAGAKLIYRDSWCAGRIGMGERWRFARFAYQLVIERGGEPLYREHWQLRPEAMPACHPLLCGEFTHFTSLYRFGKPEMPISDGSPPAKARHWQLTRGADRIDRAAW